MDEFLMSELWFDEDLIAPEISYKQTMVDYSIPTILYQRSEKKEDKNLILGSIRVNKPDWDFVTDDLKLLRSGKKNTYLLIRLGFEFSITNELYIQGVRFKYAYCGAYLWPKKSGEKNPRVYEVIPKDICDGEPRTMTIKLGPQIKLSDFGGSLGEISSELMIGRVTPAIVGYTGEEERAPYWVLRPIKKELIGMQHLWFILEVPGNCSGTRLAVIASAQLQTKLGPIPIGPKERIWKNRPSVVIG